MARTGHPLCTHYWVSDVSKYGVRTIKSDLEFLHEFKHVLVSLNKAATHSAIHLIAAVLSHSLFTCW